MQKTAPWVSRKDTMKLEFIVTDAAALVKGFSATFFRSFSHAIVLVSDSSAPTCENEGV